MAQMIKIQDYISRYEQDPHHYINQFIRLKNQRWDELKKASKEQAQQQLDQTLEQAEQKEEKRKKFSLKRKQKEADMKKERDLSLFNEPTDIEQGVFRNIPTDETKLIHFFKDHLYDVQLKWASSTISHISTVSHHIRYDEKLRILARQLPDSYFVMYKPVLLIQKAEMELCSVIITPLEVICLSFLEAEPDSVFIGSKERFWEKRATGKAVQSILNPCTSLLRSGTVVSKILQQSGVELPVKKILISRTSYIDLPEVPYGMEVVDKKKAEEWFKKQRKNTAPTKHQQFKATKALLAYGESDSKRRQEWLD
ncbi:hypothetical protein WAX46_01660 [Bacillus sp. FJAT-53060]|uniref:hypothetical protein n=1 Tax=Bacillus sp. FJAT-53060 TaxID=3127666 RepID=UPI003013B4EF